MNSRDLSGRLDITIRNDTLRCMSREPGLLEYLLAALLWPGSKSGYALCKVMTDTPLGLFSDSPGAVYPALHRMKARSWTRSGDVQGPRNTRLVELTSAGREAVTRWLTTPPAPGMIEGRPELVELRYVLTSDLLGAEAARAGLVDAGLRLDRQLAELDAYIAGPAEDLSAASRQALRLGRSLIARRLEWCRNCPRSE